MAMGKAAPEGLHIPAGLHLVSTPIGAARDITLRAIDILSGADVLAAEDTRTLRHLMEIHGIRLSGRPLIAYHDHNGAAVRPRLIAALEEGKSVAYASEAGTPLVADPGYQLARAAIEAGLPVLAAPGASAVLCALTVSGIASDRFTFMGFLPNRSAARKSVLHEVRETPSSLIFYESPHRLTASLKEMSDCLGPERNAAVCRELTKKFEEVTRGTLAELAGIFAERVPKGEIVVVVERGSVAVVSSQDLEQALTTALQSQPVKAAANMVAERFGLSKREAYQMALKLGLNS
jgi:16S rRNA (cytidine1402-2'-O)-methyltransferase